MPLVNAFTVDVEDYYQVSAFDRHIRRGEWDALPSRVLDSTRRLVELLAASNTRATFFVLGWVANKYPQLVREIVAAGHELASHSYWHRLVYELTPDEFRQDLRDSRRALEDAGGVTIRAYRAPSFSITQRSLWALPILVEEGFTTDSSIFPVYHDRYGMPEASPEIHVIHTEAGELTEFPVSVAHVGRWNIPVAGGGYFRLYPVRLTVRALRAVNRRRPFVFYIHPWEIDPDQPRLAAGSRLSRARHYLNLHRTEDKLRHLLRSFAFDSLSASLESHGANAVPSAP